MSPSLSDVNFERICAVSLTPALLGETLDHAVTAPKFKRYEGAMLLADTEIAKLVHGTVSFDNALNRLQKEVNAYLQR